MGKARVEAETALSRLQSEVDRKGREVETLAIRLQEVNTKREQAQSELDRLRQEAEKLKSELADANRRLNELLEQVRESTNFARYLHPIDLADATI